MDTIKIMPCLDMKEGRVVRGEGLFKGKGIKRELIILHRKN